MKSIKRKTLVGSTSLLVAMLSGQAYAQTTVPAGADSAAIRSGGFEEIVVTARRRSETLQNVPVAVAAISKIELANHNATDLAKLGELAPQVMIGQTATGTGALLAIRGISSGSTDSGLDQSVSVDIDGIVLSRGRIVSSAVFDLQQVEILEGPQALFFGKNSPAGVISIHTADPTNLFEGSAKVSYEFKAKERAFEGFLSGPLSSTLKARLAVRAAKIDGWVRNYADVTPYPCTAPGPAVCRFIIPNAAPMPGNMGTSPNGHNITGRGTLLWDPTDEFTAKFKLTYDHNVGSGQNANSEQFCTVPTVLLEQGTFPNPAINCTKDMKKAVNTVSPTLAANMPYAKGGPTYSLSDIFLGSLSMTKKFGDVSLTSTTGYYDQNFVDSGANDSSIYTLVYDTEKEHYRLFTQEVRLNTDFEMPLNFTAGAYFEHSGRQFYNAPVLFPNLVGFTPASNSYAINTQRSNAKSDTFSFFGQARWKITDTVELAGGARWTRDHKSSVMTNIANNPNACANLAICFYAQGVPFLDDYNSTNVSPEATLSWHPATNQTVYVAYKTGYKAGGISNGALLLVSATKENLRFQPEKVHGFEGGYKGEILDRTLRFDFTAYRYNYKNLQVTSVDNRTISFTLQNAAAARTQGVQSSIHWLATDELTLNGNIGYNRARFTSFPGSPCYAGQTLALGCVPTVTTTNGVTATRNVQDLTGRRTIRAPDLTFNVGFDYKKELIAGWTTDLSSDASYTSKYETSGDFNPGGIQPSFWRVNASLHFRNENFDFAVIGRNLTNSYYLLSSNALSGAPVTQLNGYFNRPREISVQAAYRF